MCGGPRIAGLKHAQLSEAGAMGCAGSSEHIGATYGDRLYLGPHIAPHATALPRWMEGLCEKRVFKRKAWCGMSNGRGNARLRNIGASKNLGARARSGDQVCACKSERSSPVETGVSLGDSTGRTRP